MVGRSSALQAGDWAKDPPRRGLGMVQRSMEREGQPGEKNWASHWFGVPEGWVLVCVVIDAEEQRRVYVVTTIPPAEHE